MNFPEEPEIRQHEGMSLLRGFLNPPVIYSFLLVLFASLWGIGNGRISSVAFVLLVETSLLAMIHMGVSGAKWSKWYQQLLESWLPFSVLTLVAVVAGGMIQILPTVFLSQTTGEDGKWQKVYTPLELAGRDMYVREGCYNCHSQMIRPLVGEVLRYGPSGRLAESIYDYPFQWGSKRTGPDLARVGGKYPNLWHFQHMLDPRSTSVGSNMPTYPWLFRRKMDYGSLPRRIAVQKRLGVPFPDQTDEQIEADWRAQGQVIADDLKTAGIQISADKEIIAMIAYLQQLGKGEPRPPITSTREAGAGPAMEPTNQEPAVASGMSTQGGR